MLTAIDEAKADGDTLGGVFEVIATGVPIGLGSHVAGTGAWRQDCQGHDEHQRGERRGDWRRICSSQA